jgi:CTP synthase
MTEKILRYFNVGVHKCEPHGAHNYVPLQKWKQFIDNAKSADKTLTIGIVGKYFQTGDYKLRDSYAALFDALDHAGWALSHKITTRWINSEKVEKEGLPNDMAKCDGIIVPIGWGIRGAEGMITGIKYARVNKTPYLGLCFGMQLAVIEFARHALGLKNANSTEINENCADPIVHIIPSKAETIKRRAYGGTMRLGKWECRLSRNSLAHKSYGVDKVWERHRHRYEVNNKYRKLLTDGGLVISGESVVEPLVEIIELPRSMHPFFLATQFHPEYKSRPLSPHPLFVAFLQACLKEKKKV